MTARWGVRAMLVAVAAIGLLAVTLGAPTAASGGAAGAAVIRPDDPPVLAHYYLWFTPTSWNRAKQDLPAAGRYSSDQVSVMREHVREAKAAGIDGFIVSWKSTEVLDPRLEALIGVARSEHFKLAITYQGLDFDRNPLPADRVAQDLDLFIERYSNDPVFDLFPKPLVVWSGTWKFSRQEIAKVTQPRRDHLTILASEKNVKDYKRVADLVGGDLYYWSSVNPQTYPNYPTKLVDMAAEVHRRGGLWIAPVAPGYNGRQLGGSTVVPRRDGAVLREEWKGAMTSSPDAVGIISWNEFSENTYIEPSENYGNHYLRVLAGLTGAPPPAAVDFDSSSPSGRVKAKSDLAARIALVGLLGAMVLGASMAMGRRNQLGQRFRHGK